MSYVVSLWGFWVALVVLVAVFGAAPLIRGIVWAADRSDSILPAVGVLAVFMLVWLPALVVGIAFVLEPWARSLGFGW